MGSDVLRRPLTTTHPHGYVVARADRKLGLVRISKNASTESKVRLDCEDWIEFDTFDGPIVAFVREPYARFVSSVPESVLRITELQIAEQDRGDRVVIPQDIYQELAHAASASIEQFAESFLEATEYAFFDAHHEPQANFLADRQMALRVDPRLYPTEQFERSIGQIENWTGICARPAESRSNKGGAKPLAGRTPAIDLFRRTTRTGVYRQVKHSGLLGMRYLGSSAPLTIRKLNELANRFATELKNSDLGQDFRKRVETLYADDKRLWKSVSDLGGDVRASAVWPA